jgi:hypothetical protein
MNIISRPGRALLGSASLIWSLSVNGQIPVTDAVQDGFSTITHYWFLGKQYAQD